MSAVLVKDYLDDDSGWDDVISEIKSRCGIEQADYIAMRIVRDFGYRRKDPHVPNPATEYRLTDDLYEELSYLVECEDCKNGCQIYYDDVQDVHYFQITGANFYDEKNNYAGTDSVKVYLKEFIW